MPKNPQSIEDLRRGAVLAIALSNGLIAYFCRLRDAIGIYPVVTRGKYLPLRTFSAMNWRWVVWPSYTLPRGLKYVGTLPGKPNDFPDPVSFEPPGGFIVKFRIHRTTGMEVVEPSQVIGLPEMRLIRDIPVFIESLIDQMVILDEQTNLIESYDTDIQDSLQSVAEESTPRIEVRVAKSLPGPQGSDFYDTIERLLTRSRQGTVGMRTENATHFFFDCDVKRPTKAAIAVLKGLKDLGYKQGVEVYTGEPEHKTIKI